MTGQRMFITRWKGKKVWIRLLFIEGLTDSPLYFVGPLG